jgi:N-acetyl-anhydromuramyl-L-alanine amidase AmpD
MVTRRLETSDRISRFVIRLALAAVLSTGLAVLVDSFGSARAYTRTEKRQLQNSIVDRQKYLNKRFRKVYRKKTQYIIVHTSEGGLNSTLRVVSQGKQTASGYRTRGGHAHYVIARNGRVYRTLDRRYIANHAGRSMWNGQRSISNVSVGIELVGYHYNSITDQQYRSLGLLIEILQGIYRLDDMAVLTHSQVAYGNPNRWIRKPHRGRKRCAKNFDFRRAGVTSTWHYDPDVRAGRLAADPELASIYYSPRTRRPKTTGNNVITRTNTAWNIAGEDYDDPTTIYRLPNGKTIPGDQVERRIGWNRIPRNTVVTLNSPDAAGLERETVKRITNGYTAWDVAGVEYNKSTTFYFYPRGQVFSGRQVKDWDELPENTRIIVGYRGPYEITSRRPAGVVAGANYNKKHTLYYFPNRKLVSGDSVRDFRRLPAGVKVFLPAKG